ncbi:MAG: leucine-rich repeat domain-containing protein, partial [Muribaculaceae bacterium]|nr:leucine-rich repeat domain-containing protein [Muribaculaceae bacterium]
GNPANAIPAKAFYWYGSLREIKLPSGLTTLKSGCFTGTELTAVEIPASVSTWEYNIFLNCSSLREVTVRRSSPAWINWCVFNGSPKTKLIVPVGSEAAYKAKEYWQDFKEIIGMNPVQPGSYSVELQETEGVKITPEIDAADVTPGSSYRFKVETDDSFGDATMEVYANSTRVYADESGFYTALINANTLIHANFIYPEAVSEIPSTWKITGAAQGAGLVTEVINVTPGKTFSIRANALAIPADDAAMFYAAALTDSKGAIKELISPVITNSSNNYGNLPCTFSCQVKEASVREGNLIRIVTSYNKKTWHAVEAASDDVCDRLKALGNEVRYHSVTMPSSIEGATITGTVSQIAHGMPLTVTVTPTSDNDRVTLSVNGVVKVADMATAKLTVPAVMEDLEIAVQVNPVGTQSYTVVHVNEGELETKIANTPKRLKVVGTISQTEFVAFQVNIAKIEALDLADLTVVKNGVVMTTLPTGAFRPMPVQTKSALKNIILPSSLTSIARNAFNGNYMLEEITIPAAVTKIDIGAFSTCSKLTKMTMLSAVPCELGNMQSLPSQQVTIEVPHGSLAAYNTAAVRQSEWQKHKFVEAEKIFSISIDQKRVVNADPDNVRLSTIPYPDAVSAVALALPNSAVALNNEQELHPGKAFRIYDNGIDVTETSASIKDGKYFVTFDPAVTDET